MHEGIPILNFLVPKAFIHEDGKLTGVRLREGRRATYDDKGRRQLVPTGEPDVHYRMRRRAGRGRPGERLPLDRARHRHRLRRVGHAGGRPDDDAVDASRTSSSAATRRSARRTSSGRSRTATTRRSRSTSCCQRRGRARAAAAAGRRSSARRWASTSGATTTTSRSTCATRCRCADKEVALQEHQGSRSSSASTASSAIAEAQRCLNCDVQTVFADTALHRVRRLRRHLPDGLHHLHRERRRGGPARRA